MAELPGKALAQQLIAQSREESRRTPMEGVIRAADEGSLSDEQLFRLIGRLWALERMFYYVYGGWGQGLELNERQVSLRQADLRRLDARDALPRCDPKEGMGGDPARSVPAPVRQVRDGFGARVLRVLPAQFRHLSHTIRIAALNLGPKILELHWMEAPGETLPDKELRGVFTSQLVENRSHVKYGPADRRGARRPARRRRAVPVGLHGRQAGLRTVSARGERSRLGSDDFPDARHDDAGDGLRRARQFHGCATMMSPGLLKRQAGVDFVRWCHRVP